METKQVRSQQVKVYFTPEEKQQIEKVADNRERSLSGFVRWKILQEIRPEVEV